MKEILQRLTSHLILDREEAKNVLKKIAGGEYNPSQISAFLTVYMMRMITVHELAGFRDALLELCLATDLSEFDTIDLCGTGGDGKNTFNISTLSSFVVAGAGCKVAKHGNYGVSSACGSSNVLEYLGYKFTNDRDTLRNQIDKANICFLHAPLFHPAMKTVAPIRRELSVKTFFNMLGPMVNPAFPKRQLVGVFSLELARQYGYLYQDTDKDFVILHSLDGYDEISLTGPFKYFSNNGEQLAEPADLDLPVVKEEDLSGGDTVEESARIFMNVLEGKGTSQQNAAVIANAGMALYCDDQKSGFSPAMERARETLISGKALISFKKLLNL
jgi:anthranilate phosphoribosyltransferase